MNMVLAEWVFIGTWHDAQKARNMHVVTVAVDSPFVGNAKFDLVDGPGNNPAVYRAAVEHVLNSINAGTPTLVHCVSGRSRSAAVLCSAIARHLQTNFHEAYTLVKRAKDEVGIHPALVEMALVLQRMEITAL